MQAKQALCIIENGIIHCSVFSTDSINTFALGDNMGIIMAILISNSITTQWDTVNYVILALL